MHGLLIPASSSITIAELVYYLVILKPDAKMVMSELSRSLHRWTREEYDRMVDSGVFPMDARVELVDGEILEMTPQKSPHATGTALVAEALRQCFSSDYHVRSQMPLALDDFSEPEPDVAVVKGGIRDYAGQHPRLAVLVVEVSDTTLAFDRGSKAMMYVRNGVQEYWLANLRDASLEVYRRPSGGMYTERRVLARHETIAPLVAKENPILVADLLP